MNIICISFFWYPTISVFVVGLLFDLFFVYDILADLIFFLVILLFFLFTVAVCDYTVFLRTFSIFFITLYLSNEILDISSFNCLYYYS